MVPKDETTIPLCDNHAMRFGFFLLLGLAASAQSPAFDKAAFEAAIRYYDLLAPGAGVTVADPKPSKSLPHFSEVDVHLTFGASTKDETFYLSADGQTVIPGATGSVPAFNLKGNPFQINLDKLFTANQPSFGPAGAPVTIVEFGDFECPSCRAEAPILRQLLPNFQPGKVRVVFKDYPLESIHPWARAASDAARCVYRQNPQAFWKIYDWFYDTQDEITPDNLNDKVLAWAGKSGVDAVQLGRCIASKAGDADVAKNIAEGHALNVTGTPSLFINGRKISGVDFSVLQQIIQAELDRAPKPH
jgi:protein-disulfide isomerase